MTDFHATPTGNDSLLVSCPQTEGKCDTLSRIYKAGLVTNYGTFYSAGRCRVNGINTLGQTSASLQLEAGKKYFIMALQKEATNDDHLEVAWIYPGTSREIIPGDYLSPFYFPLSVPLIPDNYLSVHIYPNPASDNVTVSLSNQKGGTIELYSMAGNLLRETMIEKGSHNASINVSGLSAGIYLVRVQTGNAMVN